MIQLLQLMPGTLEGLEPEDPFTKMIWRRYILYIGHKNTKISHIKFIYRQIYLKYQHSIVNKTFTEWFVFMLNDKSCLPPFKAGNVTPWFLRKLGCCYSFILIRFVLYLCQISLKPWCWKVSFLNFQNTTVDNIVLIEEAEAPEFEMADEDQNDILIEPDVYMCAEKLDNGDEEQDEEDEDELYYSNRDITSLQMKSYRLFLDLMQ